MFARLFGKPKWQHRDASKRCQAVEELALNDPALPLLAREDEAPEVRAAAVARLMDLEVLGQIVSSEQHSVVFHRAQSRLRKLLSGSMEGALPLAERMKFFDQPQPSELFQHVALHADEGELRRHVIKHIQNPELLAEIALNDRALDVRVSAVEHIDDIDALDRVVKKVRKSDKRIAQVARQRLTDLRSRTAKNQRLVALSEAMEELIESGSFVSRQSVLLKAEREKNGPVAVVEEAVRERFEQAISSLEQICDRYRKTKTDRQRACQILETLANELQGEEELTSELEQRMQAALAEANEYWNTVGELEDADAQSLTQRYRRYAEALIEHQGRLHENAQVAQRVRGFLDEAEKAADAGAYTTNRSISDLDAAWDKLPKPVAKELSRRLMSRYKQLRDRIEQQRERAAENARKTEQEIAEMSVQLTNAVDEGQLNEALSLRDQIRNRLNRVPGIARAQRRKTEQVLKDVGPKIRELQSWRKWGASDARQRLILQAEELLTVEQSPHERARQIGELRAAWKRVDRQSGSPASDAMWQQFNSACNRAYEPCRRAFEEEAKLREQHLQRKRELCEELVSLHTETDWDHVDWKKLVKQYNKLQQSWRQTGPVERSPSSREVFKRFRKINREIEARLDKQRKAGLNLRKQLIERVQTLANESDLNAAIEQTKRAQADWNTVVVRATRKTEKALWSEFRAACDKIFQRREAENQARQQHLDENLQSKSRLCEEIESLAQDLTADTLQASNNRIERIKRDWEGIGEVRKGDRTPLEKRLYEAIAGFRMAADRIQRLQAHELWSALADRARLCVQLETQFECGVNPDELNAIKAAWGRLPDLEEALIHDVQSRFETAIGALEGDDQLRDGAMRRLQDAAEQKRMQCLEMEVLADVDSPPECAEKRMQLKVTHLSQRFGGQEHRVTGAAYQIALNAQREWIKFGMLPAAEMQVLEQRFQKAAQALLNEKQG